MPSPTTEREPKKSTLVWLGIILAAALAVRLYGIMNLFLDSHAERQAQVAIVARNLYRHGLNVFCTTLDIFGPDSGCALLEFPLIHTLAALLYYPFGELEVIGRAISVGFSLASVVVMYALARALMPQGAALAATALYAFAPLHIYFGRAFMPESSMLFFSLVAVYGALRYVRRSHWASWAVSAIAAALAYLSKPTALLLAVPISALWFERYRWQTLRRADLWVYHVLTAGVALAWIVYANLVNYGNPHFPGSWHWVGIVTERGGIAGWWVSPQFYGRLGGVIAFLLLTPVGVAGFLAGVIRSRQDAENRFLYAWLLAVLVYLFALAGANVGHVYYQLPALPVTGLFFGLGVAALAGSAPVVEFSRRNRKALITLALIAAVLYLAGFRAFFTYMYDTSLRMPYAAEVARIIRERTPEDAVMILNQPNASPTVLTYYARRRSWDFRIATGSDAIQDLERLRARGGTIYVAVETRYGNGVAQTKADESLWRHLNTRYRPVAVSPHYLIFDVRSPRP